MSLFRDVDEHNKKTPVRLTKIHFKTHSSTPLIVWVCSCFLFRDILDSDSAVASCPCCHQTVPMHGVSKGNDVMCVWPESLSDRRQRGKSRWQLSCSLVLLLLKSAKINLVRSSSVVGVGFDIE
ncbi:hypothetical protein BLNAU_7530 [Blattamonas nauphoetae]|uniref:Uncharacterized protein n=1 Tax=Blattamonas nauphoetae TaxID=2049346 RepID=A0ABQ9Y1K5_9EUKA|nr:hypothetical protein BLNAU_7530 [Blattamonas nauphoetae]